MNTLSADLDDSVHVRGIIDLLNSYADTPLSDEVCERLRDDLKQPSAEILLAVDEANRPIGTAICFLGYSTFQAKPLLNLHDLVVLPEFRGKGIGQQLLSTVESRAQELGCCRVTLEVMENNPRAKALYHRCGFADLAESNERKFFLEKNV